MLLHLEQFGLALAYYAGLIVLMRVAGKRLAGQTTMFDLIVLISLGVVLQTSLLREGPINALIFVLTVFAIHRGIASWCLRSPRLKRWVRGGPRPLVERGRVLLSALEDEGLTYEDLLAGLRKNGHADVRRIRLATLEETGEISAIVEGAGGGP